jgi:hypothetical protein
VPWAPAIILWLPVFGLAGNAAWGSLTRLTFQGPLSGARAARIVDRLARAAPSTVLDIGCGWGELMLRTLEAVKGATGLGVDVNARTWHGDAPMP